MKIQIDYETAEELWLFLLGRSETLSKNLEDFEDKLGHAIDRADNNRAENEEKQLQKGFQK